MSNWNMGSEQHPDGSRDVVIAFVNNDANGQVGGTLTFMGRSFRVNGNWAASGSVPGRNHSALALWGTDGQGATEYVAVAGTMQRPGTAPRRIDMNLIRVSSGDGLQYGWDGNLLPV